MRLFYITDIFPSLSQIFISREIAALEALGAEVAVMSFQSDIPAHAGHALDRQLRARRFRGLEDEYGKWEKVRHHMNAFLAYPGGYLDVMTKAFSSDPTSIEIVKQLPTYCRVIDSFKPQRLHAHFGWAGMVVAWLASRVLGIPLSVTLHGSDVLVAPSPRLGEALRDADRIVCVSEHMRRTVESRYSVDPDKTAVIHCGIDPEEFPCPPRISPDLRILSVARLHPVKGLADLVSACVLLRDRGVSFHCSIVGEGPERSRLETQVNACGLNNQVRFLGALPNEELPAVYRDHSLFVLPSYSEGMPVVLMEAMATGLPVIASRVGGIPEMIKDGANGILIEPNSPAMIAQAVIDLQRKPLEEIDAMRMRNRKEIVADFNVRFEVEKLYRIFAQPSSRRAV